MQPVIATSSEELPGKQPVSSASAGSWVSKPPSFPGADTARPADCVAEVEVPDLVGVGDVVAVRRPRDALSGFEVEYIGGKEYGAGEQVPAAGLYGACAKPFPALATMAPT